MTKAIDTIKQPRIKILGKIKDFSIEQLNEVPAGFSNNILWNLGHMIAAQQGICYGRAGLPKVITDDFFMAYKPDTRPEKFIDVAEFENIKTLMFSTLDQLEADLQNKIFTSYPAFTTRYGIELASIDDAVQFLPFHEGLHIGYIMSLRKVVKK